MKRRNRDIAVAQNILREIDDADTFLAGVSEQEFLKSTVLQKATVMTLLNIGEQTKGFTDALTDATPEMPWQDMRSARNLAAHTYDALDMDDVWLTYTAELPALRKEIGRLLEKLRGGWDPTNPTKSPKRKENT